MTDMRVIAGSLGEGAATYEDGLFHLPNGETRAIEDVTQFDPPAGGGRSPHWSGDIVRGLQGALSTTTKALPSPFGFAASFVGLGLDAFEASADTLSITFADGAAATLVAGPETVAVIRRDREVVGRALQRRAPAPLPAPEPAFPAPDPSDPILTSMFRYEKRKGRLRRIATEKGADET